MQTSITKPALLDRPSSAVTFGAAPLALFSAGLFVILLAALHFLRPDLDPAWRMISEYALGDYGWMMTIAFLALGLSAICLFAALLPQTRTWYGRIGLGFLLLGATGPILSGIFRMDPIETPMSQITPGGAIHSLGAVLSDGILIGATLITLGLLRRNPEWVPFRTPMILTSIMAWIGAVVSTASLAIMLPQNGGLPGPQVLVGWPTRFVIAAYALWIITAAWCSIRVSSQHR